MTRNAITVENLSKAYRIGLKQERADSLIGLAQQTLTAPFRNFRQLRRLDTLAHQDDAPDLFWALKDVSFEVPEGEVLGVIGRNGAGKSTLLKVLSRITEPTAGRAVIRGRVASLLEVGTGFHPDLSGRDNIYMNGTILGMTKREIDRKLDQIVDFSGVEKFLDTPVKRYSSGMRVRLGFAVAAHLDPEILIVDEVLAVGDAEFQKKCIGRMQDVARGGRTVLFVSHDMAAVESLCTHAIELRAGRLACFGDVEEVVSQYRRLAYEQTRLAQAERNVSVSMIKDVTILGPDGDTTSVIPVSRDLIVRIVLEPIRPIKHPRIFVGVDNITGSRVLTVQTPSSRIVIGQIAAAASVNCKIAPLPLAPGEYSLKIAVYENAVELDAVEGIAPFTVVDGEIFSEGRGFHRGICIAQSEWTAEDTVI